MLNVLRYGTGGSTRSNESRRLVDIVVCSVTGLPAWAKKRTLLFAAFSARNLGVGPLAVVVFSFLATYRKLKLGKFRGFYSQAVGVRHD